MSNKSIQCPRLSHFARFNQDGSIGKCGHMVNAPGFSSWQEMQQSKWLEDISVQMDNGTWPFECQRCQVTEQSENPHSIRLSSIERDKILKHIDNEYIILGGVLDNICNSACQSCNSGLSTKIGSLESKNYFKLDNSVLFDCVPQDKIVELDLNGGEPTASPKYKQILENLPKNIKVIRTNTNGSKLLPNIENILDRNIHLIVTLSLDGVGKCHDYVRWPITWDKYTGIVQQYLDLAKTYKNLTLQAWTTVHALNVGNFNSIEEYVQTTGLKHDWALLVQPDQLDPAYSNNFTLEARETINNIELQTKIATKECNQSQLDNFIQQQDTLRNISIEDYL